MSEDMDPVGGNKPVEGPDPEGSSTMVTLSGQQRREPLVGDLVSSPESVVLGGENARDSDAVRDMRRLGGNGTSENVGSDPGIGSAKEGRGRVLWCQVREAPAGVLDPVAGECGVKYGKERGRGSWHGYISPRDKWGQGNCRIGSKGWDGDHALRNGEHQTPSGVLDPVTGVKGGSRISS